MSLQDLLIQRIQSHPDQRIPFTDYMEQVLYHPNYGYYSQHTISPQGDFLTSAHVSPDFAELIGEQVVEMWHRLQQPDPFTLVEMGGGSGLFARDCLRYLMKDYPDLFQGLQYIIVEKSPALRRQQQSRLAEFTTVAWIQLDEINLNSIVGCFFSNELVDAFPVHRVAVQEGRLQEIYVRVDPSGQFGDEVGELSTPSLLDYFKFVDVVLPSAAYLDGYQTEVNLAALDWIKAVAQRLQQGYVLTIDYGYPAQRYYHPARSQGTLMGYRQHTSRPDPYQGLGQQDLTAHVDFTALQKQGSLHNLTTLGLISQESFLVNLGLVDRLTQLSELEATQSVHWILQRRQALHTLMDPLGLGQFQVLVQAKGLPLKAEQNPLQGLQSLRMPLGS